MANSKCPRCRHRFSDWFVWSNARRFCFVCWFIPQRFGFRRALIFDPTDID